jgi:6-phosphogluconolactonase (cycloisomerase 2 family)
MAGRLTVPAARARKRVLKLGSGKFDVRPGKTVRARVRLTKSGRKLLARNRKVNAVATFTAHDEASQTKVTKVGLTLKLQRR